MTAKRSAGIDPGWRRLLRRHLTRREFERLRRISHNWTRNPFEFDEESGRFEVAERWPWERGPQATQAGLVAPDPDAGAPEAPGENPWLQPPQGAGVFSPGFVEPWETPGEPGDEGGGWEEFTADERLEADLDVILKACDVLSDHLDEIEPPEPAGRARAQESGEMSLTYDFTASPGASACGDLDVGRRFVRLLQGQEAFRLVEEDLGSVHRVRVQFRFRGEFDYQSKKSHLDWTLELARRLKEGRPFRGRRF